ncbi:hypothetical protein C0J52_18397 [Blattella germanica]|nr:hypothetical protein C0J52_18397 [Blattella germanica]
MPLALYNVKTSKEDMIDSTLAFIDNISLCFSLRRRLKDIQHFVLAVLELNRMIKDNWWHTPDFIKALCSHHIKG